ncbi:hypothetical protein [uncultured Flavobacterium sp.]|uniref:hypothetical protein n=1 Tax=uncultured Flavobacterium sp. TaxID=165435 RepID=UPI0025E77CA4|nr:hypothetical protein [uncultured Flavobacterium sp.]
MKAFTLLFLIFSLQLFSQDIETLSWDEARISDKVPMTISKTDFDKRFKKADSITAPRQDEICGREEEAAIKMVHYKGAKYELDNGIMNFRSVDFTKNRNTYFSIKDDWFDRTTTLKSFSKTYPGAAEYIEDVEGEQDELLEVVTLLPDTAEDYEWRFYFKDDRLKLIECAFPCD